jgi:tRNA-specific 2-thiouridylase
MNFRDIFAERVIADFCREYSLGRTPNPCIRCNQYIKFDVLLEKAKWLDADVLATGHYARIDHSPEGYRLLKAVDPNKDQSYFLYTLGQRELEQLLFPVGTLSKTEVRRLAATMGLPASDRDESQEICFITDDDYRSFIGGRIPLEAGDIVDTGGNVLGRHQGLARYTVGQRQGLGLAANDRLYVLRLDTATNRVVVGSKEQLLGSKLFAGKLSWVSRKPPGEAGGITARIRYRAPEVAVDIRQNNGTVEVRFHQPQSAIAPGQSVVFYQGDIMLGGGIIEDRQVEESSPLHYLSPSEVWAKGGMS